jgi:hypothetical protein
VSELVAYINTSGRPSRQERTECRDSDVHGNFRDSVRNLQVRMESVRVHTHKVLDVLLYIYLTDVNLDDYQNNSRLSVNVGKLPNHVKSVSLSLDLSLFDFIYFHHYCAWLQQLVYCKPTSQTNFSSIHQIYEHF